MRLEAREFTTPMQELWGLMYAPTNVLIKVPVPISFSQYGLRIESDRQMPA